jgi:opacity protein-like surface antigen
MKEKVIAGIFAVVVVIAIAIPTAAQRSTTFGGALEIAMPMGDFDDVADVGVGITGHVQYRWRPDIHWIGQLGFIAWPGPEQFGIDYGWNAIPLQVGIKYFVSEGESRFYVGGLTGFHLFTFKRPMYNPFTGLWEEDSDSDLEFGLAPMGGYELVVSDNWFVDFSARFQLDTDDLSYFGLRVGLVQK